MYNREKNEITFPHVIPGKKLDGKEIVYNNINGGMKRIADFNLVQNSFFGGNVRMLGLIKEYGIYACPAYWGKEILGFYIDDPDQLTEEGKRVLEERFDGITILYSKAHEEKIAKGLTKEELEKREALRKEALEVGIAAEMVTHTSASELKTLIEVFKSGNAGVDVETQEGSVTGYAKSVNSSPVREKGQAPRVRRRAPSK